MAATVQGDILIVDLTNQTVERESFTNEMANDFIGGRGLNASLLWNHNRAGVDPLGPAMAVGQRPVVMMVLLPLQYDLDLSTWQIGGKHPLLCDNYL